MVIINKYIENYDIINKKQGGATNEKDDFMECKWNKSDSN
jgi:hypothetical protein